MGEQQLMTFAGFHGLTAVITGGGSGIGLATSLALADQGCNVVVADLDAAAAESAAAQARHLGVEAVAHAVDVSDYEAVKGLAEQAYAAFGTVDVLCNNAGVMTWQSAIEATYQDWQWILGVNLWGVIHGIMAFLPRMLAEGNSAHIVNTASRAGLVPSAFSALYSTSKFGVVGLTETLANELVGTRVGVSVLCPGPVATGIRDSGRRRPDRFGGPVESDAPEGSGGPRMQPGEVAGLVLGGILHNELHILTDEGTVQALRSRGESVEAAFARSSAEPGNRSIGQSQDAT